jgi:hypothetical protein
MEKDKSVATRISDLPVSSILNIGDHLEASTGPFQVITTYGTADVYHLSGGMGMNNNVSAYDPEMEILKDSIAQLKLELAQMKESLSEARKKQDNKPTGEGYRKISQL